LEVIQHYDMLHIPEHDTLVSTLEPMLRAIDLPQIEQVSKPCFVLLNWVNAMVKFHQQRQKLAPRLSFATTQAADEEKSVHADATGFTYFAVADLCDRTMTQHDLPLPAIAPVASLPPTTFDSAFLSKAAALAGDSNLAVRSGIFVDLWFLLS